MSKFKPYNNNQEYLLPPSLRDFLPQGHLSYIVDEVVESMDTKAIEIKYSEMGQKSYHPKILLKILIYGYSTGIRSGRKISKLCESDIAFMYLSSMYRPDFRTINDFRKNNIEEFEKYFKQILYICKELGLLNAGRIILDSSKFRANASARRTRTKEQYEKWLERIEGEIKQIIKEADKTDKSEDKKYGTSRGDEIPKELEQKERLKARIKEVLSEIKPEESDKKINLTDNGARFVKTGEGIKVGYNCQTAVNENRIILHAEATNIANDKEALIKIIETVEQNTGEKVKEVLADSGYSSYENYEQIENKGIKGYIPDQHMNTEKEKSPYHQNKFKYNPQNNTYICPEGKELKFVRNRYDERYKQVAKVYECNSCGICSKKPMCTKSNLRTINIETREELRAKMRERLNTDEGKAEYKKRQYIIEPIFGHFKFNLKYTMFQLRGKKKVDGEYKLMCLSHNIKKIFHLNRKKVISFGKIMMNFNYVNLENFYSKLIYKLGEIIFDLAIMVSSIKFNICRV